MAPAWLMWAIAGVCVLGFYAFAWSLCRASAHADRAAERHAAATDDRTGDLDEPPAREVTA